MAVDKPFLAFLARYDVRFLLGRLLHRADKALKNVIKGDYAYARSEFITHQPCAYVLRLHVFKHLVHIGVLVEIGRLVHYLAQVEVVVAEREKQVFYRNDALHVVEVAFGHGVYGIHVLLDYLSHLVGRHRAIEPCYLAVMRHYGIHLEVAYEKHTPHDVLLHRLHLSVFGPFAYYRLYLFLGHLAALVLQARKTEDERGALRQKPHERIGHKRQAVHGHGHQLGGFLGHGEPDALRHKLAEYQGEIGQDDGYHHQRDGVQHRRGNAHPQAQEPGG